MSDLNPRIQPLGVMERWRLAQGSVPRSQRARTVAGLTNKQAGLLMTLVAFGSEGLRSKDFEAQLARMSGSLGIVGWAASDCTVTLHRLETRGLVRKEVARGEGNVRLRWYITAEGARVFEEYLDNAQTDWRTKTLELVAHALAERMKEQSKESGI